MAPSGAAGTRDETYSRQYSRWELRYVWMFCSRWLVCARRHSCPQRRLLFKRRIFAPELRLLPTRFLCQDFDSGFRRLHLPLRSPPACSARFGRVRCTLNKTRFTAFGRTGSRRRGSSSRSSPNTPGRRARPKFKERPSWERRCGPTDKCITCALRKASIPD